jgi:hypothetical protein
MYSLEDQIDEEIEEREATILETGSTENSIEQLVAEGITD